MYARRIAIIFYFCKFSFIYTNKTAPFLADTFTGKDLKGQLDEFGRLYKRKGHSAER
jgi:hypothetical protein